MIVLPIGDKWGAAVLAVSVNRVSAFGAPVRARLWHTSWRPSVMEGAHIGGRGDGCTVRLHDIWVFRLDAPGRRLIHHILPPTITIHV